MGPPLRCAGREETAVGNLKGWWKLARPFNAWRLYGRFHATNEASRRRANERVLRKRLTDPTLANLNEDQRRAVIVQEDRTLIVAGAGTGKTHTMVAKARDTEQTIGSSSVFSQPDRMRSSASASRVSTVSP